MYVFACLLLCLPSVAEAEVLDPPALCLIMQEEEARKRRKKEKKEKKRLKALAAAAEPHAAPADVVEEEEAPVSNGHAAASWDKPYKQHPETAKLTGTARKLMDCASIPSVAVGLRRRLWSMVVGWVLQMRRCSRSGRSTRSASLARAARRSSR